MILNSYVLCKLMSDKDYIIYYTFCTLLMALKEKCKILLINNSSQY